MDVCVYVKVKAYHMLPVSEAEAQAYIEFQITSNIALSTAPLAILDTTLGRTLVSAPSENGQGPLQLGAAIARPLSLTLSLTLVSK